MLRLQAPVQRLGKVRGWPHTWTRWAATKTPHSYVYGSSIPNVSRLLDSRNAARAALSELQHATLWLQCATKVEPCGQASNPIPSLPRCPAGHEVLWLSGVSQGWTWPSLGNEECLPREPAYRTLPPHRQDWPLPQKQPSKRGPAQPRIGEILGTRPRAHTPTLGAY
jgi:hypothetical protein